MRQTLLHWLILLVQYCLANIKGSIVVDSIEMVPCSDSLVCKDGMNLRIVLNASAIESSAGEGSILGRIPSGLQWTDSYGDWELLKSFDIAIDYYNASWEYHLLDLGGFWLYFEVSCNPGKCGQGEEFTYVVCPDRNGTKGLGLAIHGRANKWGIQNVDKWQADVKIRTSDMNVEWSANNIDHSTVDWNAEAHLEAIFNTSTCYQDLENIYYIVNITNTPLFIFTSKEYWQDARNNFNISVATYKRDFDCRWQWTGWHTIIPFLGPEKEPYVNMTGGASHNPLGAWPHDQLYMWDQGILDTGFEEIMNIKGGDSPCIDLTTYPAGLDGELYRPVNDFWRITKLGMVRHFQMTLDLDYTLLVPPPTNEPTPSPSSPTKAPVIPPTSAPSEAPTVCLDNLWELYETPAKIEITSTSVINISLPTVSENIIKSLAFGLNIGRELIRLDFAEYMTSVSQRRLQSNKQIVTFEFTMFAFTKDEKTMLEDTATYHLIDSSLREKFPDITNIYIAGITYECEAGTKFMTIAGQRKCKSICALNHYYETDSSACKEQVGYSVMKIIKRNYLVRILFFMIGIIAWVATSGLGYAVYKYGSRMRDKLQSECYDESKETRKESVKVRAYDADSDLDRSDLERSDLERSDLERSESSSTNSDSDSPSTNESSSSVS